MVTWILFGYRWIGLIINKLDDSMYVVDTLYGGRGIVASYFIDFGRGLVIVDVGYPNTYENLVKDVFSLNKDKDYVKIMVPTHVHLDHGGASGHLSEVFNDAKIYVHERGAKHIIDPSKLIKSVKSIFPEDKLRVMGLPKPVDEEKVIPVKGEESIPLDNDFELRIIYTPGHAPHHISVYEEKTKTIFTGDAVGILYPNFNMLIPTTPPPSFYPDLAIKSIERLMELDAERLMTPHFGVRNNVSEYLEATKEAIKEWVDAVKEKMESGDKGLLDVFKDMIAWVADKAGIKAEDVPENVIGSIYLNTMGIITYLEKKKR